MKLKMRLTLITLVLLIVAVAGVSVILLTQARALQTEGAFSNLEELTGRYSETMQSRYENYLSVAKTLAEIMNSYEAVPAMERRTRYDNIMQAIMESNPNFMGMFSIWKPNAIDGRDAEFANDPGTDATGRYMPWYSRRSGTLEKHSLDRKSVV
jgi:methyl-accepting chemotaxis protein